MSSSHSSAVIERDRHRHDMRVQCIHWEAFAHKDCQPAFLPATSFTIPFHAFNRLVLFHSLLLILFTIRVPAGPSTHRVNSYSIPSCPLAFSDSTHSWCPCPFGTACQSARLRHCHITCYCSGMSTASSCHRCCSPPL